MNQISGHQQRWARFLPGAILILPSWWPLIPEKASRLLDSRLRENDGIVDIRWSI
jgi:hypothetical protein